MKFNFPNEIFKMYRVFLNLLLGKSNFPLRKCFFPNVLSHFIDEKSNFLKGFNKKHLSKLFRQVFFLSNFKLLYSNPNFPDSHLPFLGIIHLRNHLPLYGHRSET